MYRKILVPVDGSNTSKLGLAEAFRLAASDGAKVKVLNVVDEHMIPAANPFPIRANADFINAMKRSGRKALDEAASEAARQHVKADCAQRMSGSRRVSDVIVAEAQKWGADLLVMGTHGIRGLNRLLLGSDAERVLQVSPVPVLLVRDVNGRRPESASRR